MRRGGGEFNGGMGDHLSLQHDYEVSSPELDEATPSGCGVLWIKRRHMETIQVVLDARLLRAADRAARRTN